MLKIRRLQHAQQGDVAAGALCPPAGEVQGHGKFGTVVDDDEKDPLVCFVLRDLRIVFRS